MYVWASSVWIHWYLVSVCTTASWSLSSFRCHSNSFVNTVVKKQKLSRLFKHFGSIFCFFLLKTIGTEIIDTFHTCTQQCPKFTVIYCWTEKRSWNQSLMEFQLHERKQLLVDLVTVDWLIAAFCLITWRRIITVNTFQCQHLVWLCQNDGLCLGLSISGVHSASEPPTPTEWLHYF